MAIEEYEAIRLFNEECLQVPPFMAAFSAIKDLVQLYRSTGVAQNLIVLGETGSGKTTLCKMILRDYPRVVLPDRDLLPILVVAVPPAATLASVAEAMLTRLGDPAPSAGTVSAKTARVIHLARMCGVEAILIDEANHIQDRGRAYTQYHVGDWIKALMDELGIPIVMLGLPRVEALFATNEQLRRRFTRRMRLELGQDPDTPIETQCLQLFTSMALWLPMKFSRGGMTWSELGHRLRFATDGRVAYLKVLMMGALRTAYANACDAIAVQQLEHAFTTEIWPAGVAELNPFHPAFAFRCLDRLGEPFERGAIAKRN